MDKKKNIPLSSMLDGEDLVDLPMGSFSKVSSKILETACMIGQAERGLLLFLDESGKLQLQSAYEYPHWQDHYPKLDEISKELMAGDQEVFVSPSSNYVGALLKKQGRQVKKDERRKYQVSGREYAFEELNKIIGLLYLEKEASPFSRQDIILLEKFLEFATHQLLQAKIYEISSLDTTTHFFSRSQLDRILNGEILLAQKHSYPLGVLLFSLQEKGRDQAFSQVDLREQIWWEISRIVRGAIREEDTPLRYSSTEFYIFCPCAGERGSEILGKRLIERIKNHQFSNPEVSLSLFVGLSVYPTQSDKQEDLIKKSRQALNLATLSRSELVLWSNHAEKLLDVITGDLSKDYRNVIMLLDTIIALNSTLDYKQLLSVIVDMMLEITQGDRCILITYDKKGRTNEILCQDREGNSLLPTDYMEDLIEKVKEKGMPFTEEDVQKDPDLRSHFNALGLQRVLAIGLSVRQKILGVLYVDSKDKYREFSEQDRVFFYALTNQIGLALENSRLYEENLLSKKRVEELNRKLKRKFKEQEEELEEVRDTLSVNLQELEGRYTYSNIIGKSKAISDIFEIMDKISHTDVPVLITGESGTGKELIAKALHYNSPRKEKPFVSINCAALPDSLLESELFGYKRGAFTGAGASKKGLFEMAHRGTLFLDEVGDMSLKMQKELLRVLQEGEIRPVGGREVIKVNARIIAATNRSLQEMMDRGEFREDLYYRLNVIYVHLPPLRDRKEDIIVLAEKFLEDFAREKGMAPKQISPKAIKLMMMYDWPGNIRELRNFLERTAIICPSRIIQAEDIVLGVKDTTPLPVREKHLSDTRKMMGKMMDELKSYFSREYLPEVLKEALGTMDPSPVTQEIRELLPLPFKTAKDDFIRIYLKNLLQENQFNITQAAQKAKMLRSYLHKLLNKYNLPD